MTSTRGARPDRAPRARAWASRKLRREAVHLPVAGNQRPDGRARASASHALLHEIWLHIKHQQAAARAGAARQTCKAASGCASYHAHTQATRGFRGPLTRRWAPGPSPCAAPAATQPTERSHNARRSATRLHGMVAKAALCDSGAELHHLGRRRRVHGLGPRRARQCRHARDPRRGLPARLPERAQAISQQAGRRITHRAGARCRARQPRPRSAHRPGRRSRRTPTSSTSRCRTSRSPKR